MINFSVLKNNFKLIYDLHEDMTDGLGYLLQDVKECVACIGSDELAVHYGVD